MIKKKNAYIEPHWYKLGYQNYDYFKARTIISYSGKRIFFSWKYSLFQDVLFILRGFFNA